MTMKRISLLITSCSAVACVLFGIGLVRYAARLPHDWVGIALYSAATVAFALNAIGYYIVWVREKRKEGKGW